MNEVPQQEMPTQAAQVAKAPGSDAMGAAGPAAECKELISAEAAQTQSAPVSGCLGGAQDLCCHISSFLMNTDIQISV